MSLVSILGQYVGVLYHYTQNGNNFIKLDIYDHKGKAVMTNISILKYRPDIEEIKLADISATGKYLIFTHSITSPKAKLSDLKSVIIPIVGIKPLILENPPFQTFEADKPFSYQLPSNLCSNHESSEKVIIITKIPQGKLWMHYNNKERTFEGHAPLSQAGEYSVEIECKVQGYNVVVSKTEFRFKVENLKGLGLMDGLIGVLKIGVILGLVLKFVWKMWEKKQKNVKSEEKKAQKDEFQSMVEQYLMDQHKGSVTNQVLSWIRDKNKEEIGKGMKLLYQMGRINSKHLDNFVEYLQTRDEKELINHFTLAYSSQKFGGG